MRILIRGLVLLCMLCGLAARMNAQERPASPPGRTDVRSLTIDDGLPQGYISNIVQDEKGFLWMATLDGLSRYDGYSFLNFQHETGKPATLAANFIKNMVPDSHGNLWLIFGNRVDVFNTISHKTRHLSEEPAFAWLKAEEGNISLLIECPGCIWTGDIFRLVRCDLGTGARKIVPIPAGEWMAAAGQDKNGTIWVATQRSIYTLQNDSLVREAGLDERADDTPAGYPLYWLINKVRTNSILFESDGSLLFGTMKGACRYYPAGRRQVFAPFDGVDGFFVSAVSKGPDGGYYISRGRSIFRFGADGSMQKIWETGVQLPCMMVDRTGVLWAGTNAEGVRMINLQPSGFHSTPAEKSFLEYLQDRCRAMAGGPDQPGIFNYAADKNGNRWMAVAADGGRGFVVNGTQARPVALKPKLAFRYLIPKLFTNDGQAWVINFDRDFRLLKVDMATGQMLATPYAAPGKGEELLYLLPVGRHRIGVVFPAHLELYDPVKQTKVSYPGSRYFNGTQLQMAAPDPRDTNVIWISTRGDGILRFDLAKGTTRRFTTREGLPNNTVYSIVADRHGILWCSSNRGIFRFSPADFSVSSFTVRDGLPGNEFNSWQFMKMPDGHIAFGGVAGGTVFHPDSIFRDTYQPEVSLTAILVNNKPLAEVPAWRDSAVPALQSLTLGHDQNFLHFTFAALQYNDVAKTRYRYMLEGLDRDWIEAGGQHTANYTGLAPGHYVFKVVATNTSGIYSRKISTLRITIVPPWWRTWWAYTLCGLLLAGGSWLFYRSRVRRLEAAQTLVLKEKEAAQLRRVDELKSNFFANITHEFRTPLSLIIAPLEQLQQEELDAASLKKRLAPIRRNAQQLLRLINQLLDMARLEGGSMTVVCSRGNLQRFLDDCATPFAEAAAAKGIAFEVQEDPDRREWLFDADKLQKIAANLLSNALKFTPAGGSVVLRYKIEETGAGALLCLSVKDSGIGIAAGQLPHIFKRFYQVDDSRTRQYNGTGIGLALASELTQLMGGTLSAESREGEGSIFSLYLPLQPAVGAPFPEAVAKTELPEPAFVHPDTAPAALQEAEDLPLLLIAEDNEELRDFIAGIFSRGYRVLTAQNGREGLDLAREQLPDVIISDGMMPEMDGTEFCRIVKTEPGTSHIPFVLLTARTRHESVMAGLEQGADGYLTKPFHTDELLLRVANIIRHKEQLREHHRLQLAAPVPAVQQPERGEAAEDPFLQELYGILEMHYADSDLSVEKLAAALAMSQRTLNRKLQALLGLSMVEVLRRYRLKKAAELLSGGMPVAQAAYTVGFESPAYFSTTFKALYGMTPTEWAARRPETPPAN